MNILRIVYDWPDENVITEGLAPAPYGLSVAQTKLGHKIYVLCGNLNGKNLKSGKFHYALDNSIEVFNLPRALNPFGPFLTTSLCVPLYYWYLRLTKKIDLVHNHGHLGVWFLVYKLLFRFWDKTPVIGHFHITAAGREDSITSRGNKIPFWAKNFEYPIHKFSDRLTKLVAAHSVVVSRDLKTELIKYYGFNPDTISLLESAVDISRFHPKGDKADFGFAANSLILAQGGRLSQRKNADVIVQSLKALPDEYKLVLWGKWDHEYKIKVDKLIKSHGLEARVKYVGPISYFDVDKFYRSVDIFILPSSYEGLPKVVVEALASGCKVIASGFKMEKVIPDIYFLTKLDSNALAELTKTTAKSPAHYTETRDIIEKYYTWVSKARDLDQIYERVQNG